MADLLHEAPAEPPKTPLHRMQSYATIDWWSHTGKYRITIVCKHSYLCAAMPM
jgi:hypothetical protein